MSAREGVECFECEAITYDPKAEECSACGSDDLLTPVTVTECPDPTGECDNDAHHFGIGKHVIEKD